MVKETNSVLEEKTNQFVEMEEKYQEIQKKDVNLLMENQQLTDQLQALRHEVSESESKESSLRINHLAFRQKLNQAITEQQELYKRSRELCTETIEDIKSRKPLIETEAIQQALEASRAKREQLKSCVEELRMQVDNDKKARTYALSFFPALMGDSV